MTISGSYDIRLPVPIRTQFESSTSDGRPSENEGDNCGETCDAMVLEYVTLVRLLVDEIHDMIWAMDGKGPETQGLTSIADHPAFLAQRAQIKTTAHYVTTTGDAMKVIRASVGAGRPLMALVQLTPTLDHFVVVTGAAGPDATHTTIVRGNDPNGTATAGKTFEMSNSAFFNWLAPNIDGQGGRWLLSIDTDPRR